MLEVKYVRGSTGISGLSIKPLAGRSTCRPKHGINIDTVRRDRHRLAAVLSINFLSRNSPNQLKKLMLTPGGGGRSTSRRGRKILVPQPWELETFAPGMRWPETG